MAKRSFKNKLKKAVVFGSTGLVGQSLVEQLLSRPEYGEVLCVNRRPQSINNPGYKEVINDLTDPDSLKKIQFGDEVFCCLGTTIKKAGTKAKFENIDLDLPIEIGKISKEKGVKHYLVVSSVGANKDGNNFYLRTKGRMEEAVTKMGFSQITIVRPSMLLGKREEFRFGEQAGKVVMKVFNPLLLGKWKKYRAIQAADVATAMIIIANSSPSPQVTFESNELQDIVDSES